MLSRSDSVISFICLFAFQGSLNAGYGEVITVENKLGTIISPGWAITSESFSGPGVYNPHFPTKKYLSLVNLNGAPMGDTFEISGISPVPTGWAIIRTKTGLDKTRYNIRHVIEKIHSVDFPLSDDTMPPVTYNPVDFDISSMDFKNSKRERERRGNERKEQENRERQNKEFEARVEERKK